MLSASTDIARLSSTLERYCDGSIGLEDLRAVIDAIIERWRTAPIEEKPPFEPREAALWQTVWEISASCHESLARDGARIYLKYLAGQLPLRADTAAGAGRP